MDVNGLSLDSQASQEISGLVNEGNAQTNAQIADSYNSGAGTARGLLNAPDHMNDQLSYGDRAQSDAIKAKYTNKYARSEKELSLKTMMQADQDHVRKLQSASDLANQEVQNNMQKELLRHKINQENKKARGAVVGNVLGIIGAVVAGYFTGGTGAAAGYAAGNAAGNAIGSAN